MKVCKEYFEKLIFFDDLDEKEQQVIKEHLNNCDGCRTHFEQINTLISSLKNEINSNHLNDEALVRFLIFENFPNETDYDGKKLSTYDALKIKNHLRHCETCTLKIEEMKREYTSLESFLNEFQLENYVIGKVSISKIINDRISSLIKSSFKNLKDLSFLQKPKYVLIPATVTAMLLLLFLFLPIFNRSGNIYSKLGKLETIEISYLTRGSSVNVIQTAISEFNNKDYLKAIGILEPFLLKNSEDPNQAFIEYVCGLAYLFQAEKSNQVIELDKGIEHLYSSLMLNPNTRLQENANWYIGKAYLKKENGQEAIQYFKKVKDLKGSKSQSAQKILFELEKNLTSSK